MLLTIGTFDLLSTLMWLRIGGAEGNPLFAGYAMSSPLVLVGVKLPFLFGPVLMLEFARRYRPVTAEIGTWVAAIAYLYLYVSHLLSL